MVARAAEAKAANHKTKALITPLVECVRSLRAKGKLTKSLWKLVELQIQPKDEKMRKREKR